MVSDGLTDDQWADAVVAVLEGPMHEVGMGEPNAAPRHAMWHCSAATPERPFAGSPVWRNSGGACHDITVREDEQAGGGRVLLVWTEGSDVPSCPPLRRSRHWRPRYVHSLNGWARCCSETSSIS